MELQKILDFINSNNVILFRWSRLNERMMMPLPVRKELVTIKDNKILVPTLDGMIRMDVSNATYVIEEDGQEKILGIRGSAYISLYAVKKDGTLSIGF
ncbi:MAG: hypothetical protein JHC33_02410 [Ignisphaera sp.]|nr:hypothetical protein [Ignisphaera sp.]